MKTKKTLYKLFASAFILITTGTLQSCEDFLTIYPTNQITDEDFWKDRSDLENVRAGAYHQLIDNNQLGKVLIWGELRSGNFTLNNLSNTAFYNLDKAVLMPTQGMFDWAGYYQGINYCNMVLDRGEKMIKNNVDPTFTIGDWKPIKAEMMALRSLYYFYLVRAYRDVPYVTVPITTDKEAIHTRIGVTPGVAILGDLIDSLEVAKNYAAINFGSTTQNKGRFTKKSINALLADMYLWRGCLLSKFDKKESTIVNLNDKIKEVKDSTAATNGAKTVTKYETAEGTLIDKNYTNSLASKCFAAAIDRASEVIKTLNEEREQKLLLLDNPNGMKQEKYPLILNSKDLGTDIAYNEIFGFKNSSESLLELQFDGSDNVNKVYPSYLSSINNLKVSPNLYICSEFMVNLGSVEPEKGYGKTDYRLNETIAYSKSNKNYPYQKNLLTRVTMNDIKDMSEGATVEYRVGALNANWPVYRLTDVMLIKAEAIARKNGAGGAKNNKELYEGFDLCNAIFARCNPALHPTTESQEPQLGSKRLNGLKEHMETGFVPEGKDADKYYAHDKSAADLLKLVYFERQREFLGEGKYWFDLVREAEYRNDTQSTLSDYANLPTVTIKRLRHLLSLYNPIYNEEIKINGVDHGGKLVQNPIWSRYATN